MTRSSPSRTGPRRAAAATLVAVLALLPAAAAAETVEQRTRALSATPAGVTPAGASVNPTISPDGRFAAFESTAVLDGDDRNGRADVYGVVVDTGRHVLVSRTAAGRAGNGASGTPSIASSGAVAFASSASDLVPGDTNGDRDVFVFVNGSGMRRVSVATGGAQADGDSSAPDVSADGRRVVFTSEASNLVPDDDNRVADVFLHDLVTGRTTRVSVGRRGREASGRSGSPAISPDGAAVSFASQARNLVRGDRNRTQDVFVRDLSRGVTRRATVNSGEREQTRSVIAPFDQISDVGARGRFVTFDSDAPNLVRGDRNRDTDVFVRDLRSGTTERVSVSTGGRQGDNDSFAPRLSATGRFVIFETFAENLAAPTAPREDLVVRDRLRDTTIAVNVTSGGDARGREVDAQLLQRAAISEDGRRALFVSGASNLAPRDGNRDEDVFLRDLRPPDGRVRPGVTPPTEVRDGRFPLDVVADDPTAGFAHCVLDGRPGRICPQQGDLRLPDGLRGGRHRLEVRVGGPGMLLDPSPLVFEFTTPRPDRRRPRVAFRRPPPTGTQRAVAPLRLISGRARDAGGVRRVEVAVLVYNRRGCFRWNGRRLTSAGRVGSRRCGRLLWTRAEGTTRWRVRLRPAARGFVGIAVRAVDRSGNRSRVVRRGILTRE